MIFGSITIDFTTRTTKENLLDKFDVQFTNIGTVNLVNMNDESIELEVHNHEFIELEKDS